MRVSASTIRAGTGCSLRPAALAALDMTFEVVFHHLLAALVAGRLRHMTFTMSCQMAPSAKDLVANEATVCLSPTTRQQFDGMVAARTRRIPRPLWCRKGCRQEAQNQQDGRLPLLLVEFTLSAAWQHLVQLEFEIFATLKQCHEFQIGIAKFVTAFWRVLAAVEAIRNALIWRL